MKFITIQNRKIGIEYPPLVIAEIGINHNGNLKLAKKMVDAACNSGAEVIKHQTHIVSSEMSKAAKEIVPVHANESIYEIMEKCALNEEDEIELKNYVESKGMIFLSTPFSRAAVDRLEKMNVSAYKIGSGECNNYPLIKYIASFKKPMIVSTGMNDLISVSKTVKILEDENIDYALLHTTNLYPTPPHLVRLGAMVELKNKFKNAVIGLSDHTTSNLACLSAVALGASILERHFTDSMNREGPDIINSMDPKALQDLINDSKIIFEMRGGKKEPALEEKATMDFAFATVVTTKKIKKGEIFSKNNIWVKRPGSGEIRAEHYESILGKKCLIDLDNDIHLKWKNIN